MTRTLFFVSVKKGSNLISSDSNIYLKFIHINLLNHIPFKWNKVGKLEAKHENGDLCKTKRSNEKKHNRLPGGGARGPFTARGPYGLNDVHGLGLGDVRGWRCCVCVGGQPIRTALHTISMSPCLQNSFCESYTWRLVSWKALRELNAHWALPVYLVFEDENSNGSDENSLKRKIA